MDFDAARLNMVNGQLLTNRVTDERLVSVIGELPREAFLPEGRQALAYCDEDVAIGDGRYLMEPMVLAQLIQEARPAESDVALVIGCASGYAAAVLGRLVSTVVALESDAKLAQRASDNLASLGIDNVAVVEGALEAGYAKQGPYDVIFIDGGVAKVPDSVCDQLAEGGRLVAVERSGAIGRGVIVGCFQGHVTRRECFDAAVPVLPGFEAPAEFAF